jgi:hypothetical protein
VQPISKFCSICLVFVHELHFHALPPHQLEGSGAKAEVKSLKILALSYGFA